MVKGAALRQAVVSLHSRQSLAHSKAGEDIVSDTEAVREVKEYVVVQRRMWKQLEDPWTVWGTIEESEWPSTASKG